MELRAAVEALRAGHPHARLAVPLADLHQVAPGGILGPRLAALPVAFAPSATP